MKSVRLTLAGAVIALALAGCGGGGDGGDDCNAATDPSCGGSSNNQLPVAKANGPYSTVAGGTVNFSAAGSFDPDGGAGDVLTYAWDFGDGSTGSGAQASHVYATARANPYTATLKVTDTKGGSGTNTADVTVTAAPPASANTGTMGIVLTDAPFPFDDVTAANVYVVRVDAKFAASSQADANTAVGTVGADPNAGWVTVVSPARAINLLELQSGRTTSLGQKTNMPVGTYSGFRIVVDVAQSNITLKDNSRPTVTWPGTGTIGVVITPAAPVTLAANGVNNVLVDFDLGRSFTMKGTAASGGFDFLAAQALRTVPGGTGSFSNFRLLSSNGTTPIENATVELLVSGTAADNFDPTKIVATAKSDANGTFTVAGIVPGTYSARLSPPARYNVNSAYFATVTVSAPSASGSTASRTAFRFTAKP